MSIGSNIAQIRVKTCVRRLLNRFYCSRLSIFCTLEVILSRLDVQLPRYVRKHSLAGFETGFKAFAILFLALSRLFCVD